MPEIVKPVYPEGQLRALFAMLVANHSMLGIRDTAITAVLVDTGVRVSELCDLTLSDLKGDKLTLHRTKTGRVRNAYLGQRATRHLGRYLTLARPKLRPQGEWLFVADDGAQMTRRSVRQMFVRLGKQLGFHLNPHKFRHSFATTLADKRVSQQELQWLGGWTDARTAQRYIHLANERLREAHDRAKPLDGI